MVISRYGFGVSLVTPVLRRSLSISQLKERSLICVRGTSADEFLQGLTTNDIKSINHPNSFMYSLFLNSKGRVLTDAFIYHTNRLSANQSDYLIEVDANYVSDLVKHLNRYNLRGKVKIDANVPIHLWIAMPKSKQSNKLSDYKAWSPVDSFALSDQRQLIFFASDPRGISGWSGRILSTPDASVNDIFPSCDTHPLDISLYHTSRWELGLPEGIKEFITNDTLPFEANTDLSGGVSFSKGCYIGQELTARTHFTGVIRRRYVPIKILSTGNIDVLKTINVSNDLYNAPIYQVDETYQTLQSKLKPVGWIRNVNINNLITTTTTNNNSNHNASDDRFNIDHNPITGIALIRLTEASEPQHKLIVCISPHNNCNDNSNTIVLNITPYIPSWWPEDIAPIIKRIVYANK